MMITKGTLYVLQGAHASIPAIHIAKYVQMPLL